VESTPVKKWEGALRRLRQVEFKRALPSRWAWLRLLASPTSYLLCISLLLVLWAKGSTLRELDGVGFWPGLLLWAAASDVLVHFLFIAIFAVAEARSRWVFFATVPVTAIIAFLALANAIYLGITGEQLTWEAISLGIDRFADVERIMGEQIRAHGWFTIIVAAAPIAAIPFGVRLAVEARAGKTERIAHGRERALCAAWVAGVALLVWLVAPSADSLAVARLRHNATMDTYWSWLTGKDVVKQHAGDVEFDGFKPPFMVTLDQISALRARPHKPNVLLIVLESARYDYTSLAGAAARAKTPNIAALAARGAVVRTARSVLPHTTKSVFSMLCGRMPLMQKTIVEISEATVIQCLPDIAHRAGYATGFFQSSLGVFEFRPRLVDKLGFRHFDSWETIGGKPLGYLASDDLSLAAPFARWLGQTRGKPFFATILTSAAHHPYRLPPSLADLPGPRASNAERYGILQEGADELVGKVVAELKQRGLLQSTIIVVSGDHGEGFGSHGVRQHDNNFYEEGLRVPLVFAGPGVPPGDINGNASLVDVAPSLLHLLGVDLADAARPSIDGFDLFDPTQLARLDTTPRYFSCWYEQRCRGFVLGHDKVVYIPQRDVARYFDLAADPDERQPHQLTEALKRRMPAMHRALNAHLTRRWPLVLGPIRPLGSWRCERGRVCSHPRAPKSGLFEQPGE